MQVGRLAQLVERFIYTEDVTGSSPVSPTDKNRTNAKTCSICPFLTGDTGLERRSTTVRVGSQDFLARKYL